MGSGRGLARRLAFFKSLQGLNARINSAENLDQGMSELSGEICDLFGAVRMSIYLIDDTQTTISAKVLTGMSSGTSIRVPISDKSIAGFCALHQRLLNIRNVYNDDELQRFAPEIQFRRDVDERSGFHCKQMLVAPMLQPDGSGVLGVIQLMNTLDDEPFSSVEEEGIQALAQAFAQVLVQHIKNVSPLRSKYHHLVRSGRISEEDLTASAEQARLEVCSQDKVLLDLAALLPIERQNYGLFTRFEIKYGVGSTVCWGAAVTVFICPQNDANKAPVGIRDHGVAKG